MGLSNVNRISGYKYLGFIPYNLDQTGALTFLKNVINSVEDCDFAFLEIEKAKTMFDNFLFIIQSENLPPLITGYSGAKEYLKQYKENFERELSLWENLTTDENTTFEK